MKALVSTVTHLLLVDLMTAEVNIVESQRPEYYGVSWWENMDALVLSHSGLENDALIDLETYLTSEKAYLSFNDTETQAFLSAPHQMICAPHARVIITNTGRNCITLFDTSNGFYKDIRINDIYWDRLGRDKLCGEHFNSVYLKENILYVLAHRFNRTSHILKFSYPDCILLDIIEVKGYSGLHNIWVDNQDNLFTLNSNCGEFVEIRTDEILWTSSNAHYLRGLAVSKDAIIIGDSEVSPRSGRKLCLSELWVIDRHSYRTLDYLSLGQYGAVHDVRIVDEADEAHHGFLFKGLNQLEARLKQEKDTVQTSDADIKKAKMAKASEWSVTQDVLKRFKNKINSFVIEGREWLMPKNNGFALALYKDNPASHFTISADYHFISNVEHPYVGLVFGYQGPSDTNMVTVLISYDPISQLANLGLWIHQENEWKLIKNLVSHLPRQGKFSVEYHEQQLCMRCDTSEPITHVFYGNELKGGVGLRCLGSGLRIAAN